MAVVSPGDLLDASGHPRPLRLEGMSASALGRDQQLDFRGPDLTFRAVTPLSGLDPTQSSLTYLSSADYAPGLKGTVRQAVVTTADLARFVPEGNALLLTGGKPREIFFSLLARLVRGRSYESLSHHVSPSAKVHPTAVVSTGVYVDDDAEIGPGAVVLPNTYVGKRVVLKPNCTIGGDGFESWSADGRRGIVPHAGGVWLAEGVQVGSSTCIDKGLWGDFTFVGPDTMIDNLVHFAHSARCGRACSLVAGSEVSGSVRLGDGVWIGPHVAINQSLRIGSHCFLGTAAVVTRDLPDYSLAYGSPAKVMAQVCVCRNKLAFVSQEAVCPRCGEKYVTGPEGVRRVR